MCNLLTPPEQGSHISQVGFTADGLRLAGTLYLPPEQTHRVVIGCHGLISDRTSPKQAVLAGQCNLRKIAYLAFDHRGCGQSDGDFEQVTTVPGRCRDLLAAVQFIRTQTRLGQEIGLFGSSMGGTVCLAVAGEIRPSAVVTVSAPVNSATLIRNRHNTEDTGNFSDSFYENNLQFDIAAKVSAVDHLLVFHGDADETVPVSHGRQIHAAAGSPKRIIVQKGGDHRMSDPAHQDEFIRETVAWFNRF